MKSWRHFLRILILMAIVPVNAAGNASIATGATLAVTLAPVAGNCLVVVTNALIAAGAVVSVTDDATGGSSTYTKRSSQATSLNTTECWCTDAGGVKAGITTITIIWTTAHIERTAVASQYSSVKAIGQNNVNTGAASPMTVAITMKNANNFVVAGLGAGALETITVTVGNQRSTSQGTTVALACVDNTAATASSVSDTATISGATSWGAAAVELVSFVVADDDNVPTMGMWRDWRANQYEDTDTARVLPLPPAVHVPDDLIKFDATWRLQQYSDIDTESDKSIITTVVTPTASEDGLEQTNRDWLVADQGVGDVFVQVPPTAFVDEGEVKIIRDWTTYQELFLEHHNLSVPPPPTVFQEEPIEKYVGWLAIQHEDTDTLLTTTPPPPASIQEESVEKGVDWSVRSYEDTDTNRAAPPLPPSTVDGETPQLVTPVQIQFDDATAVEKTPTPIVIVTTAADEIESYARRSDAIILQPEEELAQSPTPPTTFQEESIEKYVGWLALEHEDTETQSAATPTPPTTFQEELIEKQVDWSAKQLEDDSYNAEKADVFAPTANDADQPGAIPVPTLVDEALATEKTPPVPGFVTTEGRDDQESMSRTGDLQFVYSEEENRYLTPTPPTTQQIEETEQKNVDWQIKQQEDAETQRALAPTPPTAQQFEEAEQKNVEWRVLHEDGVESGKAPPPPTINQGFDDLESSVHAQDAIVEYHEDDQRNSAPTPAFVLQDVEDSRYTYVRFVIGIDEFENPFVVPPPPLGKNIGLDDIEASYKLVDRINVVEDDASDKTPTPPTTQIDEISERYVDWIAPWHDDTETANPHGGTVYKPIAMRLLRFIPINEVSGVVTASPLIVVKGFVAMQGMIIESMDVRPLVIMQPITVRII